MIDLLLKNLFKVDFPPGIFDIFENYLNYIVLFLQEQDYHKASFCCEELLLHNPHNHLYHTRNGDIRYTIGG